MTKTKPHIWLSVSEIVYPPTLSKTDLRFLLKFTIQDGCWPWLGAKTGHGYGAIKDADRMVPAHRYMYQLIYGKIQAGLLIRHLCHNKSCVNPAHLREGTHSDNIMDSVRDNQMSVGVNNSSAKLTERDVFDIRSRLAAGARKMSIAAEYGVNYNTIWKLEHKETWKHL